MLALEWYQAIFLLPPLMVLLIWRLWWHHQAQRFLSRKTTAIPPDIRQLFLKGIDDSVFRSANLLHIAHQLRKHITIATDRLDAKASVERTIQAAGWFTPVTGTLKTVPEYLVLIDKVTFKDHQAHLVDAWMRQLVNEGVFVASYYFDTDPRRCYSELNPNTSLTLAMLSERYPRHRLMIFTDGRGFIEPLTGDIAPWVEQFSVWSPRILFTLESPTQWGHRERAIENSAGFLVMPATEAGLKTLAEQISTGLWQSYSHPPNLFVEDFPEMLKERPRRWSERHAPAADTLAALLNQVRHFLGEAGYYWFSAGAVYPELHWPLTLYLGHHLKARGGKPLLTEARLLKLVRLPWFRYGYMPNWLREQLITNLSLSQEREIRVALQQLLLTADPNNPLADFHLEIGVRQKRTLATLAQQLLPILAQRSSKRSPLHEHVFMTFMADKLSVKIPKLARNWLANIEASIGLLSFLVFLWHFLKPGIDKFVAYIRSHSVRWKRVIYSASASKYAALTGIVIFAFISLIIYYNFFEKEGDIIHTLLKEKEKIHIAFAGPMSGEEATTGRLMTQAVQLYFDEINSNGGVNGRELVLDIFDDQNDPQQAKTKALDIKKANQAVAVIGHWDNLASISAGEIYQQYEIPAITPTSTDIRVTKNNSWYFRNIYNANTSARLLAHYIKNIFHQDTVTIIHEEANYGAYIAKVFEESALKLNIDIKKTWHYNNQNDEHLDTVFKQIVEQLSTVREEAGVILLAVPAIEGVQLVKLMRDMGIWNTIIGPASLGETTFQGGFNDFPLEKDNPGYYTNDIYVITPLIFDIANESAKKFTEEFRDQYDGKKPDWSAAYAYDTAMILVKAITEAQVTGQSDTLLVDRNKIKETLVGYTNINNALEGVTGFNYFDEHRNAQKIPALGVYKNTDLIAASNQLQEIYNLYDVGNIEQALQQEKIFSVDGNYMYNTQVVYTGMMLNRIDDLDFYNLTGTLDFLLWFSFKGQFIPEDIKFTNAVESIKLEQPLIARTQKEINYRLYRIKGRFKLDFLDRFFSYNQHTVGISFYHRDLNQTRSQLIYVGDSEAMGLKDEPYLLGQMKTKQVLIPNLGWQINHLWFFENIARESTRGDPEYLGIKEAALKYSQFNVGVQIRKIAFTLRGTLTDKLSYYLFILSSILILLLYKIKTYKLFKAFLKFIWFLEAICLFLLLLSSEIVLLKWLTEQFDKEFLKLVLRLFDILWWLVRAFLLVKAADVFIWMPLEKLNRRVPNDIRFFSAGFIYFGAVLGIIGFVYEQELTFILVISVGPVVIAIIGLSKSKWITSYTTNSFAGIIINLTQPFKRGDWVKIGTVDEGEVVEITSSFTRIQAKEGHIINLPNTIALESINQYHWLSLTVGIEGNHSFQPVRTAIIETLLRVEGILKDPTPTLHLKKADYLTSHYLVSFSVSTSKDRAIYIEIACRQIWLHLKQLGIISVVKENIE